MKHLKEINDKSEESKKIDLMQKWTVHMKRFDIYCKKWDLGIWAKWIVEKHHDGHELIMVEEMSEEISKEISLILKPLNLISEQINSNYNWLKDWKSITDYLIKETIDSYKSKVNNIFDKIDINKKLNIDLTKMDESITKWKEIEKLLEDSVKQENHNSYIYTKQLLKSLKQYEFQSKEIMQNFQKNKQWN